MIISQDGFCYIIFITVPFIQLLHFPDDVKGKQKLCLNRVELNCKLFLETNIGGRGWKRESFVFSVGSIFYD